jgi:hypothetical protein
MKSRVRDSRVSSRDVTLARKQVLGHVKRYRELDTRYRVPRMVNTED